MPTNHTQNYNLSQWVKSDKILMDDFNADNARLDAALKAHDAALATKGNVQMAIYTYKGNGLCGKENPCHIPFTDGEPTLILVIGAGEGSKRLILYKDVEQSGVSNSTVYVNWSKSGVSWYTNAYPGNQLNEGRIYTAFMFYKLD